MSANLSSQNLIKGLLLLFAACTSLTAHAQGAQQEREYTRQRDAANLKAANAESIRQNEANNRPVETNRYATNNSSTNDDAARSLVERWKSRYAPAVYYPPSPEELAKMEARNAEMDFYANLNRTLDTRGLEQFDQEDWYRLLYYGKAHRWPFKNRAEGLAALRRLQDTLADRPYDAVKKDIIAARVFPASVYKVLNSVYRRYPQQKQDIEETEFLALVPMMYGGIAPGIHPDEPHYPKTCFELGGSEYVPGTGVLETSMFDRIVYLDSKYPQLGVIAAGACRPHLNFYNQLGTGSKFTYSKKLKKSQKKDYCLKVFATQYAADITKKGSPAYLNRLATLRLSNAGFWLKQHAGSTLEDFTVADWLAVGKAQKLSMKEIAGAFYWAKGCPNLMTAVKTGE